MDIDWIRNLMLHLSIYYTRVTIVERILERNR